MTKQEESEIIGVVVTIFQNVGIKRCIDKIDILKNYQIYFEICKVIFPQTMIQLLRFSEGSQSNAEKIQAVIDIVGNLLQNDLYHISGAAISQGKLSHIKNFLHILELLSENVHKVNRSEEEVESAPQNTRSISDYDQEGHYTVIGIDREFQRQYDDDDYHNDNDDEEDSNYAHDQYQDSQERNNQLQFQQKQNQFQNEQTENQDSQSQRPMSPVMDKKQKGMKKKVVKQKPKPKKVQQKINIQIVKPKAFKRTGHKTAHKQILEIPKLQEFMKRKQVKDQVRKKTKSTFVRKINNIIEDFEAKRLTDLKLEYNIWVRKHEIRTTEEENRIEEENNERIELANQLIVERKRKIDTLRNASQAVNTMSNLFKEQRNIWRGMAKAKQQAELEEIEAIIRNDEIDHKLLRSALMAVNPQNVRRRK